MKNYKIHVVEDDNVYRRILLKNLRAVEGTDVSEYDSVEGSLSDLTIKPDIIILDHFLAKANGIDCVSVYRHFLPKARIIIVSSQEDIRLFASALEFGADHYIYKDNFEISRIMSILETYMKTKQSKFFLWNKFNVSEPKWKKTKTIYILEDNPNSVFIIEHLLSSESGNNVTSFSKTIDFIRQTKLAPPDIVILDYALSEQMNGLDILRIIKKNFPDVHVIILSEQKKVSLASEMMKEGASHYLVKSKEGLMKLKSIVETL